MAQALSLSGVAKWDKEHVRPLRLPPTLVGLHVEDLWRDIAFQAQPHPDLKACPASSAAAPVLIISAVPLCSVTTSMN